MSKIETETTGAATEPVNDGIIVVDNVKTRSASVADEEGKKPEVVAKSEEIAEESDSSGSEDKDDEGDTDDGGEPKADLKGKKPNKVQRRINKLNQKLSAKEQEMEYWRQEALKHQKPVDKEEAKVEAKVESKDGEPNPDDFETAKDYLKAVARWEINQERAAEAKKTTESKLKADHAARQKRFFDGCDKVAETEPDFQDVVDQVDGKRFSPALESILFDSEDGARIAYEMIKAGEFDRINSLSYGAAARAIGRIEAGLEKKSEPSKEKVSKEKVTTKAPQPLDPVTTKTGSSLKKSIFDPNISQAEYEKLRNEMKARTA